MFSFETTIRVRFAETDQMGYLHHGNYAELYEVARTEMLRSLGMSYKSMEEDGVMMPVIEMKCKYIKPAFYDDEIRIKVIVEEKPAVRITFKYELYNQNQVLINMGETMLVFVNIEKNRPCMAPKNFLDKIQTYFP